MADISPWWGIIGGALVVIVQMMFAVRRYRRLLVREMRLYTVMLLAAQKRPDLAETFEADYLPWIHQLIARTARRLRWVGGPARPHELDRAHREVEEIHARNLADLRRIEQAGGGS